MIASLPMYDWPEVRSALDRFWQAIAANLPDAPSQLTRRHDLWADWLAPDLLLGQTCSLPFATRLKGQVHLVGTLDLDLPGCPAGHYNSALVALKDAELPPEPLTARLAINEGSSQSGWGALWREGQRRKAKLGPIVETGAHRQSVQAVADGRADVAAVDAQSWRLAQRFDDAAAQLRVIGHTPPTPGLPLITAFPDRVAKLQDAITTAIPQLSQPDSALLGITGLTCLPASAYYAVSLPPPP